MRIATTISCIINGVCLFETDVTAVIDYKVDRYNELEWWVDEYRVEGEHRVWNQDGTGADKTVSIVVPEKLADIFDQYLDREWMEEQVRDRLVEDDDRGDYLRDMAMDR